MDDMSELGFDDTLDSNDTDNLQPEVSFEAEVLARLEAQTATLEGVRQGVNTIGEMMNGIADAFGQIMVKVEKGGIGALLGGFMGGKKDE